MQWIELFYSILMIILVFGVVLSLAYLSTKMVVKVQMNAMKNKNIKVLEGVTIAPQKTLELIQVGEDVFLIGITKDSIVKIDKIDKGNLVFEEYKDMQGPLSLDFKKVLKDIIKKDNTKNG